MKALLIALLLASTAVVGCQSDQAKTDPAKAESPAKTAEQPAKAATSAPAADPAADKPANAPTSDAAQPDADQKNGHFGAAFTMEASQPLSAVLDKPEDSIGKTIKVTGKVASVCKKKGCWMVMQPDEGSETTVRITMKDYGFFVPKNCDGEKAIVEGVWKKKELSEAQRKHLAEDQGKDPATVKGTANEWTIVANGITIGG